MIAIPLLFGRLTAADYEDWIATDPRIDELRAKMECVEVLPSRATIMTGEALHC